MLGLANSLSGSQYVEGVWTPCDMSSLTVWLKVNNKIRSDQEGSDPFGSQDHRTSLSTMEDADKIHQWNSHACATVNATQATQSKKPVWETDAADVGGLYFSGSKVMELSEDVVLNEDTDFTIAIRFRAVDLVSASYNKAFMGSATSEFIRINDETTFRMKINGTTRDFALASGKMESDEYYTLLIVRSDGSTGNLNMFIRGNESLDGTATGTQIGSELQDTGEITINGIGGPSETTGQAKSFIKDLLIWDETAASSADRKLIFDYIEGQE